MPRKKSNTLDEIKRHAIYVLLSPFDNNVYLGHCGAAYLKNTYSKQYNMHHKPTAHLFKQAKEESLPVHMFLLQEVECSTRKLFSYTICWATHLLKHGYSLGMSESLVYDADDFTEETAAIYELIKQQSLAELLDPSKSLFPNYKQAYKEHSDTVPSQIKFRVTAAEYEKIVRLAKSDGVSLSHFCRHKALYSKTVKLDVTPLCNIYDEYVKVNALLKQIMIAIYSTKTYYPADLSIVQDSINKITELKNALSNELLQFLDQINFT